MQYYRLSHKEALPFVVDLRLSINLRGITSRISMGMYCEHLVWCHPYVHSPKRSGIFYGSVSRFCDGIRIRRCCRVLCSVTQFVQPSTLVRLQQHVNVVTASDCNICDYGMHAIGTAVVHHRYSQLIK